MGKRRRGLFPEGETEIDHGNHKAGDEDADRERDETSLSEEKEQKMKKRRRREEKGRRSPFMSNEEATSSLKKRKVVSEDETTIDDKEEAVNGVGGDNLPMGPHHSVADRLSLILELINVDDPGRLIRGLSMMTKTIEKEATMVKEYESAIAAGDKPLRRKLESSSLLYRYLSLSPQCEEIVRLLRPKRNETRGTRMHLAAMNCLSAIIEHCFYTGAPRATREHLCRWIIAEHMRWLYSVLTQENIYATIAVLRLLRAVVRSSQAAAMQFSASFNFSFKEFALQARRVKRVRLGAKEQLAEKKRMSAQNSLAPLVSYRDISSRSHYLSLVIALLESGVSEICLQCVTTESLLPLVVKTLSSDSSSDLLPLLRAIDSFVVENRGIHRGKKSSFLGGMFLDQLVDIVSSCSFSKDVLQEARCIALKICCHRELGIAFPDPQWHCARSGQAPLRNRPLLKALKRLAPPVGEGGEFKRKLCLAILEAAPELAAPFFSSTAAVRLDPPEYIQRKAEDILMGTPQDGNENKKMEQREESEECSIAASWIELASFIISYMRLSLPPFNSEKAPTSTSVLAEAVVPRCIPRKTLSQILQHPSALVRFYGVLLLVAALKSCVTALSQIREQKGKVMEKGVPFNSRKTNEKQDDRENEPRFNQREEDSYTLQADAKLQLDEWNEYEESLLRDVRSRLPDLQVLIAQLKAETTKDSTQSPVSSSSPADISSRLLLERMLRAARLFQQCFPDAFREARFSPVSLLVPKCLQWPVGVHYQLVEWMRDRQQADSNGALIPLLSTLKKEKSDIMRTPFGCIALMMLQRQNTPDGGTQKGTSGAETVAKVAHRVLEQFLLDDGMVTSAHQAQSVLHRLSAPSLVSSSPDSALSSLKYLEECLLHITNRRFALSGRLQQAVNQESGEADAETEKRDNESASHASLLLMTLLETAKRDLHVDERDTVGSAHTVAGERSAAYVADILIDSVFLSTSSVPIASLLQHLFSSTTQGENAVATSSSRGKGRSIPVTSVRMHVPGALKATVWYLYQRFFAKEGVIWTFTEEVSPSTIAIAAKEGIGDAPATTSGRSALSVFIACHQTAIPLADMHNTIISALSRSPSVEERVLIGALLALLHALALQRWKHLTEASAVLQLLCSIYHEEGEDRDDDDWVREGETTRKSNTTQKTSKIIAFLQHPVAELLISSSLPPQLHFSVVRLIMVLVTTNHHRNSSGCIAHTKDRPSLSAFIERRWRELLAASSHAPSTLLPTGVDSTSRSFLAMIALCLHQYSLPQQLRMACKELPLTGGVEMVPFLEHLQRDSVRERTSLLPSLLCSVSLMRSILRRVGHECFLGKPSVLSSLLSFLRGNRTRYLMLNAATDTGGRIDDEREGEGEKEEEEWRRLVECVFGANAEMFDATQLQTLLHALSLSRSLQTLFCAQLRDSLPQLSFGVAAQCCMCAVLSLKTVQSSPPKASKRMLQLFLRHFGEKALSILSGSGSEKEESGEKRATDERMETLVCAMYSEAYRLLSSKKRVFQEVIRTLLRISTPSVPQLRLLSLLLSEDDQTKEALSSRNAKAATKGKEWVKCSHEEAKERESQRHRFVGRCMRTVLASRHSCMSSSPKSPMDEALSLLMAHAHWMPPPSASIKKVVTTFFRGMIRLRPQCYTTYNAIHTIIFYMVFPHDHDASLDCCKEKDKRHDDMDIDRHSIKEVGEGASEDGFPSRELPPLSSLSWIPSFIPELISMIVFDSSSSSSPPLAEIMKLPLSSADNISSCPKHALCALLCWSARVFGIASFVQQNEDHEDNGETREEREIEGGVENTSCLKRGRDLLRTLLGGYGASLHPTDRLITRLVVSIEADLQIPFLTYGGLYGELVQQCATAGSGAIDANKVAGRAAFDEGRLYSSKRLLLSADCLNDIPPTLSHSLSSSSPPFFCYGQNVLSSTALSPLPYCPFTVKPLPNQLPSLLLQYADTQEDQWFLYDPSVLLPSCYHFVNEGCDLRKFIEFGALSVAMSCLSCKHPSIRLLAYALLSLYDKKMESARFKEAPQIKNVLFALRNTIEKENQCLPTTTTAFLQRIAPLLLRPSNPLYLSVNRFLLQRPLLDLGQMPMFYMLLNASNQKTSHLERLWGLETVAVSLHRHRDYKVFKRWRVMDLLISFHESSITDVAAKRAIRRTFQAACAIPRIVGDLAQRGAFITWLHTYALHVCFQLYASSSSKTRTATGSSSFESSSPSPSSLADLSEALSILRSFASNLPVFAAARLACQQMKLLCLCILQRIDWCVEAASQEQAQQMEKLFVLMLHVFVLLEGHPSLKASHKIGVDDLLRCTEAAEALISSPSPPSSSSTTPTTHPHLCLPLRAVMVLISASSTVVEVDASNMDQGIATSHQTVRLLKWMMNALLVCVSNQSPHSQRPTATDPTHCSLKYSTSLWSPFDSELQQHIHAAPQRKAMGDELIVTCLQWLASVLLHLQETAVQKKEIYKAPFVGVWKKLQAEWWRLGGDRTQCIAHTIRSIDRLLQ